MRIGQRRRGEAFRQQTVANRGSCIHCSIYRRGGERCWECWSRRCCIGQRRRGEAFRQQTVANRGSRIDCSIYHRGERGWECWFSTCASANAVGAKHSYSSLWQTAWSSRIDCSIYHRGECLPGKGASPLPDASVVSINKTISSAIVKCKSEAPAVRPDDAEPAARSGRPAGSESCCGCKAGRRVRDEVIASTGLGTQSEYYACTAFVNASVAH